MEGGGHQTPPTLRTALDREPSLVINTATLSCKGLSTNDVATTKNQVSLKKMTKYSKEGIRASEKMINLEHQRVGQKIRT